MWDFSNILSMRDHIIRFIVGLGVAFGMVIILFAVLTFMHSLFDPGGSIRPIVHTPGKSFCTLEARLCPDGSAVGRSGPNCEFTPCPHVAKSIFTDFDRCAAAGNPVMESYPRRCSIGSRTYTENIR